MHNITFITSNDNKLREAEAILGISLERQKLEIPEIQSMDLKEVVESKLTAAYKMVGKPIILEDAGLYFEAWNGFPGPFVKWLADTMGYDALLKALPSDNRKATWRVIYGYTDGEKIQIFEGIATGTIAPEKRGENGWGFDPIFIPDGESLTFAELGEKKFDYSARKRALVQMHEFLSQKEK